MNPRSNYKVIRFFFFLPIHCSFYIIFLQVRCSVLLSDMNHSVRRNCQWQCFSFYTDVLSMYVYIWSTGRRHYLFQRNPVPVMDFWILWHLGRWVKGYFWLLLIPFSRFLLDYFSCLLISQAHFGKQKEVVLLQFALGFTYPGSNISLGAGKYF